MAADPTVGSSPHGVKLGPRAAATEFQKATAIRTAGENRFRAEVHEDWSVRAGPSGGYLAAILVRALQAHPSAGARFALRSLTINYLRRANCSELELNVHAVQSGRRVLRAAITAMQGDVVVLTGTAVLAAGDLAELIEWQPIPPLASDPPNASAPEVPVDVYRPGHWLRIPAGLPPVIHRAKIAPCFGYGRFSGRCTLEPPSTGGWIMLREPEPIDAAYLALCADIWWPAALEPISRPARAPTLELTIHFRTQLPADGLPSDPILGHFKANAAIGGIVDEDAALYGVDGTLLAQARQLSLLVPVD